MAEKWKKFSQEPRQEQSDVIYEVEDTIVVRRVRKSDLENQKANLQKRMDEVDADLAKLDELEKAQ